MLPMIIGAAVSALQNKNAQNQATAQSLGQNLGNTQSREQNWDNINDDELQRMTPQNEGFGGF